MAKKLAMQDIILTLQQFWAKQGCMLRLTTMKKVPER